MPELTIRVGGALFRFLSKQHWVDKGRSWYATCGFRPHELITLDAAGRVCRTGAEFMRAEEEGTYPISVYPIDPERAPDPELVVAGTNKEIELRATEQRLGDALDRDQERLADAE